jgi:hypothetical protein
MSIWICPCSTRQIPHSVARASKPNKVAHVAIRREGRRGEGPGCHSRRSTRGSCRASAPRREPADCLLLVLASYTALDVVAAAVRWFVGAAHRQRLHHRGDHGAGAVLGGGWHARGSGTASPGRRSWCRSVDARACQHRHLWLPVLVVGAAPIAFLFGWFRSALSAGHGRRPVRPKARQDGPTVGCPRGLQASRRERPAA